MKQQFLIISLLLASVAQAVQPGDSLSALAIDTKPDNFVYKPNGLYQVITVYPARSCSLKASHFNTELQTLLGYCPLALTDMTDENGNGANPSVEKKDVTKEKHKPVCPVSFDESGYVRKQWVLPDSPVTIVVDGEGVIVFMGHEALTDEQKDVVISFMTHNRLKDLRE